MVRLLHVSWDDVMLRLFRSLLVDILVAVAVVVLPVGGAVVLVISNFCSSYLLFLRLLLGGSLCLFYFVFYGCDLLLVVAMALSVCFFF